MAKKKAAAQRATKALPIKLIAELLRGGYCCTGLAFSPNTAYLAACAGDHKIHFYDVAAAKRLSSTTAHSDGVNALCFSPDSHWLASAGERKKSGRSAGGEVLIWNVATRQLHKQVTLVPKKEDVSIGPLLYAPDGKHVVCLVIDFDEQESQLALVDAQQGKVVGAIPVDEDGCLLAFAPSGKTLAGAFDDRLVLWQFPSGKQQKVFKQTERTTALTYSPDGKTLAVAAASGVVTLLSATTGKAINTLSERPQHPVDKVQFSADGLRLATIGQTMHGTSQGEVRIWDLKLQQVAIAFAGRTGVESPQGFPGACALSADLQLFANAGVKTRLWHVGDSSTSSPGKK